MEEKWMDVEGYEGIYQVSNTGRIKSYTKKVWNGKCWYTKQGRVLKQTETSTGYWKVELVGNGNPRKSFKVHRLVAKAFIPEVEGKTLINHKDGDPLNNVVSNLEWCEQSHNMQHAYDTGLRECNFHKYKDKIEQEYMSESKPSIKSLAKKYECSQKTISNYFSEKGIEIRSNHFYRDKYKINRKKMVAYFQMGLQNKDIAELLNTNRHLIGAYRYKYKKGELII